MRPRRRRPGSGRDPPRLARGSLRCGPARPSRPARPRRCRSPPSAPASRSARANTSTAAFAPTPKGRSRTASSDSDRRPVSASASTSPASRRSVSRMARWRISSRATTVTACWRMSRSKSPRPPASRAATSHAWGPPRPRIETGSTKERPASSGWSGANSSRSSEGIAPVRAEPAPSRTAPAVPLRLCTSPRTYSSASSGTWRRNSLDAIVSPRADSTQTAPPVVAARARTTSSSPRSSSTSRSSRLWIAMPALQHLVLLVHQPRERLLRQRDERQLVRHLEHREVELAGLLEERLRQLLVIEAGPEPEPGELVARQQPHELALAFLAAELDARGEQELAAGQPRGRVRQLGDVHPPHRRVRAVAARRKLEAHLGDEAPNGEHLSAGRSCPRRR